LNTVPGGVDVPYTTSVVPASSVVKLAVTDDSVEVS
jgi:hypothetical protein